MSLGPLADAHNSKLYDIGQSIGIRGSNPDAYSKIVGNILIEEQFHRKQNLTFTWKNEQLLSVNRMVFVSVLH